MGVRSTARLPRAAATSRWRRNRLTELLRRNAGEEVLESTGKPRSPGDEVPCPRGDHALGAELFGHGVAHPLHGHGVVAGGDQSRNPSLTNDVELRLGFCRGPAAVGAAKRT